MLCGRIVDRQSPGAGQICQEKSRKNLRDRTDFEYGVETDRPRHLHPLLAINGKLPVLSRKNTGRHPNRSLLVIDAMPEQAVNRIAGPESPRETRNHGQSQHGHNFATIQHNSFLSGKVRRCLRIDRTGKNAANERSSSANGHPRPSDHVLAQNPGSRPAGRYRCSILHLEQHPAIAGGLGADDAARIDEPGAVHAQECSPKPFAELRQRDAKTMRAGNRRDLDIVIRPSQENDAVRIERTDIVPSR